MGGESHQSWIYGSGMLDRTGSIGMSRRRQHRVPHATSPAHLPPPSSPPPCQKKLCQTLCFPQTTVKHLSVLLAIVQHAHSRPTPTHLIPAQPAQLAHGGMGSSARTWTDGCVRIRIQSRVPHPRTPYNNPGTQVGRWAKRNGYSLLSAFPVLCSDVHTR